MVIRGASHELSRKKNLRRSFSFALPIGEFFAKTQLVELQNQLIDIEAAEIQLVGIQL